jgi:hypothetical protein
VARSTRGRPISLAYVGFAPTFKFKHFAWMPGEQAKTGVGRKLLEDSCFVKIHVAGPIVQADLVDHFARDSGASKVE